MAFPARVLYDKSVSEYMWWCTADAPRRNPEVTAELDVGNRLHRFEFFKVVDVTFVDNRKLVLREFDGGVSALVEA